MNESANRKYVFDNDLKVQQQMLNLVLKTLKFA